jgi:hypothetical protein
MVDLRGGRRKIETEVSPARYDSLRCWLGAFFLLRQAARKCADNSVTLGMDVLAVGALLGYRQADYF